MDAREILNRNSGQYDIQFKANPQNKHTGDRRNDSELFNDYQRYCKEKENQLVVYIDPLFHRSRNGSKYAIGTHTVRESGKLSMVLLQ